MCLPKRHRNPPHARTVPPDGAVSDEIGLWVPTSGRSARCRLCLPMWGAALQMRSQFWPSVLVVLLAAARTERGGAFLVTNPSVRAGGTAARQVGCTAASTREARAVIGSPPPFIGRLRGGGWGGSSSLAVKKAAADEEDALAPPKLSPLLSPPPIKVQVRGVRHLTNSGRQRDFSVGRDAGQVGYDPPLMHQPVRSIPQFT